MAEWSGKSKGGYLGYYIFISIIKHLGISFAYFLLKFVAFYFVLFSDKKTIKYFYRKRLGYSKWKTFTSIYKNFNLLGEVLIDKIAVLFGVKTSITYDFEGEKYIHQLVEEGKGGLLLGSHMGNWEVGGQLLERIDTKVNVVIFDGEEEKLKQLLDNKQEEKPVNFIAIKENGDHLRAINDAFKNNELVVIQGDRYVEESSTIPMQFLGSEARFSYSPLYMASRYGVPVSFVHTIKENSKHYHFYASEPKRYKAPRSIKTRQAALKEMLQDYVDLLEKRVLQYPTQWFNHYPFWEEEKDLTDKN